MQETVEHLLPPLQNLLLQHPRHDWELEKRRRAAQETAPPPDWQQPRQSSFLPVHNIATHQRT